MVSGGGGGGGGVEARDTLPTRVLSRTTTARRLSRLHQLEQQEEAGAVASWCDLPSDLYGHILRRLPSRRDRVRLGAVCRHWRVCARRHLPRLPMRVTRTRRGTHVVHVRGLSRLHELQQQCGGGGGDGGGFLDSPAFAVAGLHWAVRIRYYKSGSDGGDDGDGHVGAFVTLLTEGTVARASLSFLLVDQQTTGVGDTVAWGAYPTLFDARVGSSSSCCSWSTRGTEKLATRSALMGSRFVRGDCLKIECFIHVFRDDGTRITC